MKYCVQTSAMRQPGFVRGSIGFSIAVLVTFTLAFTIVCTVSVAAPAAAYPLSETLSTAPTTVPIAEIAMAKKPLFSFSGKRPSNLGVQEGKLAPCPNTPNCVSSQAPDSDAEHYIAAIAAPSAEPLTKLKSVIESMERTQIVSQTENYLYAEFTSALMGFVDDVEFYLDPAAQVIHVRSASRLGQSDLGVNRKRVEDIRSQLS